MHAVGCSYKRKRATNGAEPFSSLILCSRDLLPTGPQSKSILRFDSPNGPESIQHAVEVDEPSVLESKRTDDHEVPTGSNLESKPRHGIAFSQQHFLWAEAVDQS